MSATLTNAPSRTGILIPKGDLRAIPAQGAARIHLDSYAHGWVGEPIRYAIIKRVFSDLAEAGILARLDQLCFVALDEQGSLLNWVRGGSEPINAGMAFLAGHGMKGDGVSAVIVTGVDPTAAESFSQNSCHVSVFMTDTGRESVDNIAFGHTGGANARTMLYPNHPNGVGFRITSSSTTIFESSQKGQPGLYLLNRTGPNSVRVLINNSLEYSSDNSTAASSLGNVFQIGNHVSGYGDGTYAGWSIGGALMAEQETLLAQAFDKLAAAFLE